MLNSHRPINFAIKTIKIVNNNLNTPKWQRTMNYEIIIKTNMKRIGISLILILTCVMVFSQDKVVDYLHVGKTLKFQDKKFELKWCQHPIEAYYLLNHVIDAKWQKNFNIIAS